MLSKCHFKVHSSIIKMTTEKLWLFWYSTACTARAHNFICLWFNNILLTEMLWESLRKMKIVKNDVEDSNQSAIADAISPGSRRFVIIQTGPSKMTYVYNGIKNFRIKWYTRSICTLLYIYQFWRFVYQLEQSVIDYYARISLYILSFCTNFRLHVYHLSSRFSLRKTRAPPQEFFPGVKLFRKSLRFFLFLSYSS